MNPYALFSRGIALSGVKQRREKQQAQQRAAAVAVVDSTRAQWLNALLVDETRAWLSIGEESRATLTGLISVLTLAGLAKAFDDHHQDSPEVRIIRGAISAADQCASAANCVISVADARAFHAAAGAAVRVIKACTNEAIVIAADYLNQVAGSGARA